MQKSVALMADVDKSRIEAGQNLPHTTEIDVSDRVIRPPFVPVQLDELAVLQKGDFNARRHRINNQFFAQRQTLVGSAAPRKDGRPDHKPGRDITSSCGGFCATFSSACAWPSYGASFSYR
jgi:hypothetical protein